MVVHLVSAVYIFLQLMLKSEDVFEKLTISWQ